MMIRDQNRDLETEMTDRTRAIAEGAAQATQTRAEFAPYAAVPHTLPRASVAEAAVHTNVPPESLS